MTLLEEYSQHLSVLVQFYFPHIENNQLENQDIVNDHSGILSDLELRIKGVENFQVGAEIIHDLYTNQMNKYENDISELELEQSRSQGIIESNSNQLNKLETNKENQTESVLALLISYSTQFNDMKTNIDGLETKQDENKIVINKHTGVLGELVMDIEELEINKNDTLATIEDHANQVVIHKGFLN